MADINVRLQPRASRNEIVGERNGVIVVRVTAAPVGGKANDALCRLIADAAGVAPSRVTIARGRTTRQKKVCVDGVDGQTLRRALGV